MQSKMADLALEILSLLNDSNLSVMEKMAALETAKFKVILEYDEDFKNKVKTGEINIAES